MTYNRYSYCLNNPLKYIDPSGNTVVIPNERDRKFINNLIDPQSQNYSKSYHTLYQKLDASDREYSFESWKFDANRGYDGLLTYDPNNSSRATINFTMDDNPQINDKIIGASKYRVLFEETFHAGQLETFGEFANSAISEAQAWKFSATAPGTKYTDFNLATTVMGHINKSSVLGVALMFKFGYNPSEGAPVPALYKDFPLNSGIEKNFLPWNR
jgi:hypothetical protein